MRTPGVVHVTRSVQRPTHTNLHVYNLDWPGKDPDVRGIGVHNGVEHNFMEVMNLKLLQGRGFSKDIPTDSTGYIINETARKMIGVEDPVGLPLTFFEHTGTIIGVVEDFHLTSLYNPIEPLVLFLFEPHNSSGYVLIKIERARTHAVLNSLGKIYSQLEPKFPFTYQFAEDHQQDLYQNEQIAKTLSDVFAVVSVAISCMGLLGLCLFMVEQRIKEIGIRKTLGASVFNIFLLLSKDFIGLVVVAIVLALPLSYYLMDMWLSRYAYHITLGWYYFIPPAIGILAVTFITVSFQLFKAAIMSPIKSLKTE